jgi:hypothetical protein
MRADLLLAALASAASFACGATPAADPGPPPASSPEAERRIAELEEENALLREQVDALSARLGETLINSGNAPVRPSFPSIEALVLDVKRELELVVLDKGKMDGVEVGFVFDVYRGATYRGLVRITDVQNGISVGKILSQKSPIVRGDSATTSL